MSNNTDQPFSKSDIHNGEIATHLERINHEFSDGFEFLKKYPKSVTVFGSSLALPSEPMYAAAEALGGRIVRDLGYAVATGGGPGIMEAANRGASEAGAPSVGFNIGLPHEQQPNAYSTPDLTFQFHYFAVRKLHFAMRANALVVFPGGFGTLDELFELLTLIQTFKMPPIPVVLVKKSYWTRVISFDTLVAEGMVAPADLELFSYADDAEGAWQELVRRGLKTGPRPTGYPSKIT